MKERPNLFSAQMVRAILAGTKTQTRRVVKLPHMNPLGEWQPTRFGGPEGGQLSDGARIPERGGIWHTRTGDLLGCLQGPPGDRLWVREAWRTTAGADDVPARSLMNVEAVTHYEADESSPAGMGKLRQSIFMPRWASRITLEITGVRVERLQDISIEDAKSEGVWGPDESIVGKVAEHFGIDALGANPRLAFRMLWEQLHGAAWWERNPWVWVIEFRRLP